MKPRPIDAPPKMTLQQMGYGDSSAKCNSCAHFDAGNSECKLASEPVDPNGHCAEYEQGEGTDESMPEEFAEGEQEQY